MMETISSTLDEYARRWRVAIDAVRETRTSSIALGERDGQRVVLKLARETSDEQDSGALAAAFSGRGMVRVYEHTAGAALFEYLSPGSSLAEVAPWDDAQATEILAQVITNLHGTPVQLASAPTVEQWGRSFRRYLESGDQQIERGLVEEAAELYTWLARSQHAEQLLHGDLQHYNILLDDTRGWIAIDPKGVTGEVEYELGAALRNPHALAAYYSSPAEVERRVRSYAEYLPIDAPRVFKWAYAQGVLSAIWTVEDDGVINPDNPALQLVGAVKQLL